MDAFNQRCGKVAYKSWMVTVASLILIPLVSASEPPLNQLKNTQFEFFSPKFSGSCLNNAKVQEKQAIIKFHSSLEREIWSRAKARTALAILRSANSFGLPESEYCLAEISNIVDEWDRFPPQKREYALSLSVSRFLHHQRHGWQKADKSSAKMVKFLDEIAQHQDSIAVVFERAAPQVPAYPRLLRELARLRQVVSAGGLPKITPVAKKVSDAHLQEFLQKSGDLKEATFDQDALDDAIKSFQTRHGLTPDGVVGRKTIRAMQTPIEHHIQQLLVTLERLRSRTIESEKKSIIVNIPAFHVYALHSGKLQLSSRSIIGTDKNETVPFDDEIEYIVLNPKWHIPKSIFADELLPELQENWEKVAAKGISVHAQGATYEVSEIDWEQLNTETIAPYRLVQAAGKSNPLGQLKIIFPNKHSIYLHDTPFKHLFLRDQRKFSHGCIRLEKPLQLASFLLEDNDSETSASLKELRQTIATKKRKVVPVRPKVPVHLVYHTVDAWQPGRPRFYPDTYKRNKKLVRMLKRRQ